jgi:hypothetical protein
MIAFLKEHYEVVYIDIFSKKQSVIFVLGYGCEYEFQIRRSGTGSSKNTFFAGKLENREKKLR